MSPGQAVDGAAGEQRFLLPLVGMAAAIALWVGAEEVRDRVRLIQQQQLAGASQPARSAAGALAQVERSAAAARHERAAIESGLQNKEPLALLQTRFLYDLRQRCQASGVQSCVVKFSSEASRAPGAAAAGPEPTAKPLGKSSTLADKPVSEVGIEDLGLAKARAIVTGSFQAGELLGFIDGLRSDGARAWRINGLVVRANNFELDVEQLVRPPAPAPGRGGL